MRERQIGKTRIERRVIVGTGREQCYQIGRFIALWATFQRHIDIWRLFTGHTGRE